MSLETVDAVDYTVVRSERRTADIIVERTGEVIVRAPTFIGDAELDELVQTRRYRIRKAQAELREVNASRVLREFRNGETFLYLGRSYRLSLVLDQEKPLLLKDGRFTLRRDLVENGDATPALNAFRYYYLARGLERLSQRVAYFAPKVGVAVSRVDVRGLGNRWASCTPRGNLAFHWKCMMAPLTIIDYIVVHELCHLLHHDHSDAFWNEVDKVIPESRSRKEWLRINGAALNL